MSRLAKRHCLYLLLLVLGLGVTARANPIQLSDTTTVGAQSDSFTFETIRWHYLHSVRAGAEFEIDATKPGTHFSWFNAASPAARAFVVAPADTTTTDPIGTPEPGTVGLLAAGTGMMVLTIVRKRAAQTRLVARALRIR